MDGPEALEILREAFEEAPFVFSFGLAADHAGEGFFVARLAIDARHQIDATFVHGGCIAALSEHTARFAARTLLPRGHAAVTSDFRINYLAGASGNRLVCKSSAIAAGRHGLIVDSTVLSGPEIPDRTIAVTRSTVGVEGNVPLARAVPPSDLADVVRGPARPSLAPRGTEGRWVKEDFTEGWRQFCGVQVADAGYGRIDLTQPVKPSHRGLDGVVHPGVIATLADFAGGACAYSTAPEGERLATLELTLSYLHPCRAEILRGRARIIKAGKTVMLSRVDVLAHACGADVLVATALVTVTRVPGHARVLGERPPDAVAATRE